LYRAGAANKIISAGCAVVIPDRSTTAFHCRTVPHGGFAAVQDDISKTLLA
jgi:hypothetical protein